MGAKVARGVFVAIPLVLICLGVGLLFGWPWASLAIGSLWWIDNYIGRRR